jgi:4-diphosphocytidyl-2-C-methyl-D-erythritol kinase
MLACVSPAKINRVLEVLGKRSDDYHEIRSLVQTINLCDVLSFGLADEISFECTEPSLQTSDNLVVRAAELLRLAAIIKGRKLNLRNEYPGMLV